MRKILMVFAAFTLTCSSIDKPEAPPETFNHDGAEVASSNPLKYDIDFEALHPLNNPLFVQYMAKYIVTSSLVLWSSYQLGFPPIWQLSSPILAYFLPLEELFS